MCSASQMRRHVFASHRPPCPVGQPSTVIASATACHVNPDPQLDDASPGVAPTVRGRPSLTPCARFTASASLVRCEISRRSGRRYGWPAGAGAFVS